MKRVIMGLNYVLNIDSIGRSKRNTVEIEGVRDRWERKIISTFDLKSSSQLQLWNLKLSYVLFTIAKWINQIQFNMNVNIACGVGSAHKRATHLYYDKMPSMGQSFVAPYQMKGGNVEEHQLLRLFLFWANFAPNLGWECIILFV